jgi:ferritin-like metal-binding protein YciE
MNLTSLHAFYVESLKMLYSAEHQVVRALPKMARVASASELRRQLTDLMHTTQAHTNRLDTMFVRLGVGPKGRHCYGVEALISEGRDVMGDDAEPAVADAALIAAAQRMGCYLMADFGSVRTLARRLGDDNATVWLQEMLDESRAIERRLTELADTHLQPTGPECNSTSRSPADPVYEQAT